MCLSVDGGLPFLHHLEQGCLCLGWCPVHLVHKYDIGEHWSCVELELLRLHIKDTGAQYVAGHEVGCELHAAELSIDEPGCKLGEQCLGHAWHTL